MIPGRFEYHAHETLSKALSLRGQFGEDGKLAGDGQTYHFCCGGCRHMFEQSPEKYLESTTLAR